MKFKKTKLAVGISLAVLIVAMAVITVCAYFSSLVYVYTADGNKEIAHLGMNLSLLFDKLDSDSVSSDVKDSNGNVTTAGQKLPFDDGAFTYDSTAKWGTAKNPYVISDIRHLQNLSALQDLGYFYELNIKNNYDSSGNYIPGENDKPYFLICKPDGSATTIDGTGIVIKPIGSEEFPFIGCIDGAFVEGSSTTVTVGANDLQSDTSTIFNIVVKSKRSMPDHGLFGHIHYLGDDASTYEGVESKTEFNGYISTLSDLLLVDVQLQVDSSIWDTITTFIADHIFSFSSLDATSQAAVPHETNHVGILAGHVTYSNINNISIYYSADDIVCLDINDQTFATDSFDSKNKNANYFSSTGIIGYIYSMNPEYNGNKIKIGSGSNSTSVSFGNLGGGGSASGNNPGYVLAAEMYSLYSQYSKPPVLTADGLPTYKSGETDLGIMIQASYEGGEAVYTDELGRKLTPSSGNDPNRTWTYKMEVDGGVSTVQLDASVPYFFCQTEITRLDADGNYVRTPVYYTSITGHTTDATYGVVKLTGSPLSGVFQMTVDSSNNDLYLYSAKDGEGKALCTQWYRDRIILSLFGSAKEATGRYYFYDGVFTFALSHRRDVIREIWPSSAGVSLVPAYVLADAWEKGTLPNDYTFKTYLTPVTSISSDKTYVLAYEKTTDADGNALSTPQLYFMNLLGGSVGNQGSLTQSLFTDITSGLKVVQTAGGGYEIDVTKSDAGRGEKFKNMLFRYSGNQLRSYTDNGIYLGVKTVSTLVSDSTSVSYYPYADAIQTDASTTVGYNGYGFTVNLTYNSTSKLWNVHFQDVSYYTGFLWWWDSNTTQRYLSFNLTNNVITTTATSPGTGFKIYEIKTELALLSPEDDPSYGLVPTANSNKLNAILYANQYVLYPQSILGDGTNVIGNTHVSADPIYSLIDVTKLGYNEDTQKGSWRYEDGSLLGDYRDSDGNFVGLKYMFDLVEGSKYGEAETNLFGGDWDGDGTFIKATLGTDGAQAYIPLGCISFKVNKEPTSSNPIKIRVIVAVPTGSVPNELGYDEDYYFALWKSSVDAGTSATVSHLKNNALYKFELPRSQPLYNGENRVDNNATAIKVQYDADGNGRINGDEATTTYSTYFQGETVLVAYEFTVTEKGVYTLGATKGPMQIVYFSADGVASMGRDGTGGAQLEGIDFVYDNVQYLAETGDTTTAKKIVTVTTQAPENVSGENYNYYYPTYCLLYLDNNVQNSNEFVRIYHEKIVVRRRYTSTELTDTSKSIKTQLIFKVLAGTELSTIVNNRYVKLEQYAQMSDDIKHDQTSDYVVTLPPTS